MDLTEKELRELAQKRVEERSGFLVHLLMYVVGMAGMIVIWKVSGAGYPWFIWPLLGWGIAIVAHGASLYFGPTGRGGGRAVEREMQRLRSRPQT